MHIVNAEVAIAVDRQFELGEGGRAWSGGLRWVDLLAGALWELDISSGEVRAVLRVDVPLGAVEVLPDGRWLAASGPGIFVDGDTGLRWLHRPEEMSAGRRMNDAGVDPVGRFLAGSMSSRGDGVGRLYSVDLDGTLRLLLEDLAVPNGPVFSNDGRTMYLADSSRSVIYSYEYDLAGGVVGARSVFATIPDGGFPDGMTVDDDDHLWSAIWGTAKINRYDPVGALQRTIDLPATQPTSCTFAGPDLRDLYVTTASVGLDAPGRFDGRLLVCRDVGVVGRAQPVCRVSC